MVTKFSQNIPLIGLRACETDIKIGKLGICDYVGYSENTVLQWIRTMDFPARKLGGKWVSTTEEVYNFFQQYVSSKNDRM